MCLKHCFNFVIRQLPLTSISNGVPRPFNPFVIFPVNIICLCSFYHTLDEDGTLANLNVNWKKRLKKKKNCKGSSKKKNVHKLLALNPNPRRDQDLEGRARNTTVPTRKKKNLKGSLWKNNVHKLLALNPNQRRDQDLQGRTRKTTLPTRKKKNLKGSLWKENVHRLLALNRNQRRHQELQRRRRNTTLPTRNKTGNESFFVFYLTPRLKYFHLWRICADVYKERKLLIIKLLFLTLCLL